MIRQYYVYILTNYTNTVYYVGVTNDLLRRVYEHKNKLITGFTSRYNLKKLVYFEVYEEIETAISREKQLKDWRRSKKDHIISTINPDYKDLYDEIK